MYFSLYITFCSLRRSAPITYQHLCTEFIYMPNLQALFKLQSRIEQTYISSLVQQCELKVIFLTVMHLV